MSCCNIWHTQTSSGTCTNCTHTYLPSSPPTLPLAAPFPPLRVTLTRQELHLCRPAFAFVFPILVSISEHFSSTAFYAFAWLGGSTLRRCGEVGDDDQDEEPEKDGGIVSENESQLASPLNHVKPMRNH